MPESSGNKNYTLIKGLISFSSRSRGPKFTIVIEALGDNEMDEIRPF
jgi:hypothetical protein